MVTVLFPVGVGDRETMDCVQHLYQAWGHLVGLDGLPATWVYQTPLTPSVPPSNCGCDEYQNRRQECVYGCQ